MACYRAAWLLIGSFVSSSEDFLARPLNARRKKQQPPRTNPHSLPSHFSAQRWLHQTFTPDYSGRPSFLSAILGRSLGSFECSTSTLSGMTP